MHRLTLTAVCASGALAIVAAPAAADERTCRGTLGAITVDNLRVPQGATCTLNGTRLKGQLVVERGATLNATRIAVNGNVQAEGARSVRVASGQQGGSMRAVVS